MKRFGCEHHFGKLIQMLQCDSVTEAIFGTESGAQFRGTSSWNYEVIARKRAITVWYFEMRFATFRFPESLTRHSCGSVGGAACFEFTELGKSAEINGGVDLSDQVLKNV